MRMCLRNERDWLCTAALLMLGGFPAVLGGCGAVGTGTPTAPTLSSIVVTPSNGSVAQGMTQQFKATGTYSDNSTQDLTTTVKWSSSATSVVTISATGLASGVGFGTTTIKAASSSIIGSTTFTITASALSQFF